MCRYNYYSFSILQNLFLANIFSWYVVDPNLTSPYGKNMTVKMSIKNLVGHIGLQIGPPTIF